MGGHVVPMEVAGVGVGVVAHLAAVRVLWWPLVGAETPDADGGGIISRAQAAATIGVEVCQLRLDLLLHLEIHQVGAGAGGAGLGVQAAPGARAGKLLVWRFWKCSRIDQVGDGEPLRVPEHLGDELFLLLFDGLPHVHHLAVDLKAFSRVPGVPTLSVWLLHAQVEDRSRLGKVVVA